MMGEAHESACALRVSAVGADVAGGGKGGGGGGGWGGVEEHVDACDGSRELEMHISSNTQLRMKLIESAGGGSLFSGVMNAAPANQACVYMWRKLHRAACIQQPAVTHIRL